MTIKAFAFSAQQRVAERCSISLQRSHVYESLAAAFGVASYASLCAESVFDVGPPGRLDLPRATETVAQRLAQLGISDATRCQVASELASIVSTRGLCTVRIDRVIDSLLSERIGSPVTSSIGEGAGVEYDDAPSCDKDDLWDAFEISNFLRSGLEEAAKRGNPKAHYALALILTDDEKPFGSSYWHDRRLAGDQLSGVELEWANAHGEAMNREAVRLRHLREAARLGHPDACVDAAEELGDPKFMNTIDRATVRDPARASEVAANLGQLDHAAAWCAMAAQGGDIEAVRQMIEQFDREDLLRCWMWLHFAELLGFDLTRDDYHAVNEDGSEYDDDVGGPAFPVGRNGITLPDLDERRDVHARQLADAMAARLRVRTGDATP